MRLDVWLFRRRFAARPACGLGRPSMCAGMTVASKSSPRLSLSCSSAKAGLSWRSPRPMSRNSPPRRWRKRAMLSRASTSADCEFVPRFLPDTNCIVALLLPWHEHHTRAKAEMERRLDDGEVLVLAAHTLVETYAVLTRLSAPHRLLPTACRTLLEANFAPETVEVVTLAGDDHR